MGAAAPALDKDGQPIIPPDDSNKYLLPHGKIVFSYLYSYARSDRIYFHREHLEQADRDVNLVSIQNEHVAAFEYIANPRLSLFFEIPFQVNSRNLNAAPLSGGAVTGRLEQHSAGLADCRAYARYWLWDPECRRDHNISILLGTKIPTGDEDSGSFHNGRFFYNDVSIQTGTGAWDLLTGFYGYQRVGWLTGYMGALYRFAPANQTSALALDPLLADPNSTVRNSIPDNYSWDVGARAALGTLFYGEDAQTDGPLLSKLVQATGVSFTVHGSGIPQVDRIGHSDGFRRSYHAVFLQPGVDMVLNDRLSAFANVPVTVFRNLRVPGSFPEVQLNLGVAFKF